MRALAAAYDRYLLGSPRVVLAFFLLLAVAAAVQLRHIRVEASADSLLLKGDPDLKYFREIADRYQSSDFLVVTWRPDAALFSDASLLPLRDLAAELSDLEGVASVISVWDVPLLQQPGTSLSDVTGDEGLPTLASPGVDRGEALREFRESPIYADLLVSRDADVTAIQVNLERDSRYQALLEERQRLRSMAEAGAASAGELERLDAVQQEYRDYAAVIADRQAALVEEVRLLADRYREHGEVFVGGVPMIAADMVAFVRSDLLRFGAAIGGLMLLMLALIFRRVRWVAIPLLNCGASVLLMLGILATVDWRLTVISSNFVAVLLIVTLALSIHLVVRYRELHARRAELSLDERVRQTTHSMAVPCLYTALTTVVAFVSLVVSGIQPVIDFGWMMTLGIGIAFLVTFTLVPSLMLLWPGQRAAGASEQGTPFTMVFARITDRHGRSVLGASLLLVALSVWGATQLKVENRFIDYFKESTEIHQGMKLLDSKLGGTIPLDILLEAPDREAPLPGLEGSTGGGGGADEGDAFLEDDPFAEGDPFARGASSGTGGAVDADAFGKDDASGDADPFAGPDPFAGGDPFAEAGGFDDPASGSGAASEGGEFEPSFWFSLAGMRLIDEAHSTVAARSESGKVLSLSTLFSLVRQLLGEDIGSVELALVQRSLPPGVRELIVDPYFSADHREARITVRVMETSESLERDRFLTELHEELAGLGGLEDERVRFTGMLVLYNNVLQSLFQSQIQTLGAVFLAILAMLWMLFRSLPLAFIALLPNLIAAGLVLGIMGLAGIPLDIMTITIAAIVVGIGVDNCVHYVYRFRREFSVDGDYVATLYRCHGSIGRALYYTTLTIVIGFGVLTLSNFRPSLYFGVLTVVAMIAAVLGALLLLPRLFILLKPFGPDSRA